MRRQEREREVEQFIVDDVISFQRELPSTLDQKLGRMPAATEFSRSTFHYRRDIIITIAADLLPWEGEFAVLVHPGIGDVPEYVQGLKTVGAGVL